MKKQSISRRGFLQSSATGVAITTALSYTKVFGANDRIRLGTIGTGGRCRSLMGTAKNNPDVSFTAISDVYSPRLEDALEHAPNAKQYSDYRALLDDKNVDAVIIGSPDHWHARMTTDAVNAGKDVYVEKPVTHKLEEGAALIQSVEASKRIVQTGTQQRSWEHFILGKQLVDGGALGDITSVRMWWYQNYYSRRVPKEINLSKLDQKAWLGNAPAQEVTALKYRTWRWYWDFGGGALTDLMSHWIDVVHWYTGSVIPASAMTTGQTLLLKELQCPDTITCVLEYPKNFNAIYHGQMTSSVDDGGLEIRGTNATMKLDRSVLTIHPEGGERGSKSGEVLPSVTIRSRADGTIAHLRNWLDCVKSRQTPTANIRVAVECARVAHIGNLALKHERKVRWNAKTERIEG